MGSGRIDARMIIAIKQTVRRRLDAAPDKYP